jgi:hypothetical protein
MRFAARIAGWLSVLLLAGIVPRAALAQTVQVPTFLVATGTQGHTLQNVAVAVGADSRVLFAWGDYDSHSVSSSNAAMTRRYTDQGVALNAPLRADIAGRLLRPEITAAPGGGYVATWVQSELDGGHAHRRLGSGRERGMRRR